MSYDRFPTDRAFDVTGLQWRAFQSILLCIFQAKQKRIIDKVKLVRRWDVKTWQKKNRINSIKLKECNRNGKCSSATREINQMKASPNLRWFSHNHFNELWNIEGQNIIKWMSKNEWRENHYYACRFLPQKEPKICSTMKIKTNGICQKNSDFSCCIDRIIELIVLGEWKNDFKNWMFENWYIYGAYLDAWKSEIDAETVRILRIMFDQFLQCSEIRWEFLNR